VVMQGPHDLCKLCPCKVIYHQLLSMQPLSPS
jgi:hypothetical protein